MTTIQDEDDYGAWQNPDEGYGGQDNPQTLYADAGGSKQGPGAQAGSGSRAQKAKTAAAIKVSVNPASKIKLEPFVALLAKTPGLAPELKGRIVLDKKSNAISVPDFSGDQPVPGKEWLVSLGKAGSDWEITTASSRNIWPARINVGLRWVGIRMSRWCRPSTILPTQSAA
jgi:hypothetical protein